MLKEYFDVFNKDGKEYVKATFTVDSMNIKVIDEVRRRLREFDDEFRCGRNTGTNYRLNDREVDFTIGIPADQTVEYVNSIIEIFNDVNNNIDKIIND